MIQGHATADATAAYAAKHSPGADFFSRAGELSISSLGLGTYLQEDDDETDRAYEEAITFALGAGINHLDTAIVYRGMRSERVIGRVLGKGKVPREAVLVATKGGYVPGELVAKKKIARETLVKGSHTLLPKDVEAMLEQSRQNLQLETIDIYYIHNPETQLQAGIPEKEFYERCWAAFEVLEAARKSGKVVSYGTATWSGYRIPNGLQLEKMLEAATAAARGSDHGFKWVQLPISLAMPEAVTKKTQRVKGEAMSFVDAARKLGVHFASSGSIAQGELAHDLPKAIRWVRSVPGLTTALVGMSKKAHVEENLSAARQPKLTAAQVMGS
jgi:aryl-alcohol dehydrogenase-like predicted oxidoreductase